MEKVIYELNQFQGVVKRILTTHKAIYSQRTEEWKDSEKGLYYADDIEQMERLVKVLDDELFILTEKITDDE
jgi:hypothetical protein